MGPRAQPAPIEICIAATIEGGVQLAILNGSVLDVIFELEILPLGGGAFAQVLQLPM